MGGGGGQSNNYENNRNFPEADKTKNCKVKLFLKSDPRHFSIPYLSSMSGRLTSGVGLKNENIGSPGAELCFSDRAHEVHSSSYVSPLRAIYAAVFARIL
jgi:hypothetical protein